jgi:hypothetical protein
MLTLTFFEDSTICTLSGYLATDYLEHLLVDERWPHNDKHLSMGWYTFMGNPVHYLNSDYFTDIVMGLVQFLGVSDLRIQQGDYRLLPMTEFEPYNPPDTQDDAIKQGYIEDEMEDRDDVQLHAGAFRVNYPVI